MDVTDILRDRMQQPDGLQRMVTVSIVVHAALFAFLVLGPMQLVPRPAEQARTVMTISLSGAGDGPRNGGFTAAAGRAVQEQAPPDAKREPVRPAAAKTPEMVLPTNKPPAKAAKTAAPNIKQAPDDARGRTASRGAETNNAAAYAGARGQGFGLSTGGGPGAGLTLDVG